ncbi:class I SAM-dependent methyltransferase [Geomesophilobacter sediminis]|uniref:Class I SAM-dependent methyltransferase n=1 Tax=Geomesophilobacter sediminis TaxID=2798584 RepID=A0A8J7J065_9BACT|nr:methyltransferase domain-containing protein [Geomesophilobacter sediminis]MBJ6725897.1 class I SAM-dependent methyltransferase [Geomesophilobacter sediminis]
MDEDRIKWDQKYQGERYFFSLAPSRFLSDSLKQVRPLLPGLRALDIACGEGRNSIYLAQEGFAVTGIDISGAGLARGIERAQREGVTIDFIEADLDHYQLSGPYDLIVNFNFLLRQLIDQEIAALTPGGVLILETIMDGPNLDGQHKKEFLLQPGELRRIFSGFAGEILMIEELPNELMPVARGIFRKGRG